MDTTIWLELFRPFRGMKKLEVTGGLVSSIELRTVSSVLEREQMQRPVLLEEINNIQIELLDPLYLYYLFNTTHDCDS